MKRQPTKPAPGRVPADAIGTAMKRKHSRPLRNYFGTHIARVPDGTMAPRYWKDNWLGVARCRPPQKGRDVISSASAATW